MITRFYKILNNIGEVVYIGVTTRKLTHRFREHIRSKNLDPESYKIVEVSQIIHPQITSMEVYYAEHEKVALQEQKYIREELDKGSALLNLSSGGEWGTQIAAKVIKEEFLQKYGSYEGYRVFMKHRNIPRQWMHGWVRTSDNPLRGWLHSWKLCRGTNLTRMYLYRWACSKSRNRAKSWLHTWVKLRKSSNSSRSWLQAWVYQKTKHRCSVWLLHWVHGKTMHPLKRWVKNWVHGRNKSVCSKWVQTWVSHKGKNRGKAWAQNWVNHRSRNKCNRWLQSWVLGRSVPSIKRWLRNWTTGRALCSSKVWLRSWVYTRKRKI